MITIIISTSDWIDLYNDWQNTLHSFSIGNAGEVQYESYDIDDGRIQFTNLVFTGSNINNNTIVTIKTSYNGLIERTTETTIGKLRGN